LLIRFSALSYFAAGGAGRLCPTVVVSGGAGALAGVGSSPNPHIVSPKITIKVAAKLTIVPQPRREWSE
jgi:hypothetical protein